jgi:hypothetical protein
MGWTIRSRHSLEVFLAGTAAAVHLRLKPVCDWVVSLIPAGRGVNASCLVADFADGSVVELPDVGRIVTRAVEPDIARVSFFTIYGFTFGIAFCRNQVRLPCDLELVIAFRHF